MLLDASHQIHAHPELNYEEHFAHDLLTELLEGEGLAVERHAYGLDTAFAARAGTSGPTIAVLCEYDALPGIGHACGHNIIATAGLGAGLAAAALAEEVGGRVVVLGTPAEEGGGGKILMAQAGAFDGVDAAMMVHPAGLDLARMNVIAVQEVTATYTGEAAHAAAFPHRGRNALDAAVLGYMNVAALRQHIRPDERIHGIFTKGGDKPNIVPAQAETHWIVRSPEHPDPGTAAATGSRRASRPGAAAAGCEIELEWKDVAYADMLDNEVDGRACTSPTARPSAARSSSRTAGAVVVGSTDMGNVSYVVPSIHPMIQAAPGGRADPHAGVRGPRPGRAGDRAVVDGAKAMAMTVADLWLEEGALAAARAEFAATIERVGVEAQRSAIGTVAGA